MGTGSITCVYAAGVALIVLFLRQGVAADVPDGVVYTDLHKSVQQGEDIVLNCAFYRAPVAVYWKKGDDPESSPDLLVWVDSGGSGETSGPCVEDIRCNYDANNYSLIIRDARIADEGRYICRVSNYLGILIYNHTDVKIFAPPKEPYPVIDKCIDMDNGLNSTDPCSIEINETIIITCSVTNYYPQIDLFFLHGSQKITGTLNPVEQTNIDGTKNKSISIEAGASKIAYTCVASGIPGSRDQKAATILVKTNMLPASTTRPKEGSTPLSPTVVTTARRNTGNQAAKIVVPIIILLLIIGAAVFLWWKRPRCFRRAFTNDYIYERHPGQKTSQLVGDLSYYELWSLVYETPRDDVPKLYQVLSSLNIKGVDENMTASDVYHRLCKWREGNKKDQAKILQSALETADLETRWERLCGHRERTDMKVSQATLEQIIRDIGSGKQIQKFLDQISTHHTDSKDTNHMTQEVSLVLKKWQCDSCSENPNALLSLALEKSGYHEISKTFFAGMVSFLELQKLSRRMTESEEEARATLENLNLELGDRLTEEDMYELLCEWKSQTKSVNQGQLLLDALKEANFTEAWTEMTDLRNMTDTRVSDQTLKHILWQIKDPTKLGNFFRRLTDNDLSLDDSIGMKDIIQHATVQLGEWKGQMLDENPVVLLCHALEETECCPVDRSFFKVPFELTADIIEYEVESFVNVLTKRHIESLAEILHIDKDDDAMSTIVSENKTALFNTDGMLNDWIREVECSNYEKRLRLNMAVVITNRPELKGHFGKEMKPEIHLGTSSTAYTKGGTTKRADVQRSDLFESEFQRIATYLSFAKVKELFDRNFTTDNPTDVIRAYAEYWMAKHPGGDLRGKLREKLKPVYLDTLIPCRLSGKVYLCELLDIAFRLLLEDVHPLATVLDIPDEELSKHRVACAPNHLTKGTTAKLFEFSEANNHERGKICEAFSKAGYENLSLLLHFGHLTSLADEFAVISKAQRVKEGLQMISKNLGMNSSNVPETFLSDWRSMVHHPSYNQRTSLADAVHPVLGVSVAVDILSGKYRKDGSETSAVIRTISNIIDSLEISLLKRILEVKKGDSEKRGRDDDAQFRLAISIKLADILGVKCTQKTPVKQVIEMWEERMKSSLGMAEQMELSDNLLKAGFKQFAFEIMTGFKPRTAKQKKQDEKDRRDNQDMQIDRNNEEATRINEEIRNPRSGPTDQVGGGEHALVNSQNFPLELKTENGKHGTQNSQDKQVDLECEETDSLKEDIVQTTDEINDGEKPDAFLEELYAKVKKRKPEKNEEPNEQDSQDKHADPEREQDNISKEDISQTAKTTDGGEDKKRRKGFLPMGKKKSGKEKRKHSKKDSKDKQVDPEHEEPSSSHLAMKKTAEEVDGEEETSALLGGNSSLNSEGLYEEIKINNEPEKNEVPDRQVKQDKQVDPENEEDNSSKEYTGQTPDKSGAGEQTPGTLDEKSISKRKGFLSKIPKVKKKEGQEKGKQGIKDSQQKQVDNEHEEPINSNVVIMKTAEAVEEEKTSVKLEGNPYSNGEGLYEEIEITNEPEKNEEPDRQVNQDKQVDPENEEDNSSKEYIGQTPDKSGAGEQTPGTLDENPITKRKGFLSKIPKVKKKEGQEKGKQGIKDSQQKQVDIEHEEPNISNVDIMKTAEAVKEEEKPSVMLEGNPYSEREVDSQKGPEKNEEHDEQDNQDKQVDPERDGASVISGGISQKADEIGEGQNTPQTLEKKSGSKKKGIFPF